MDIVLEVFDTFVFDRLYSAILPSPSAQYGFKAGPSNVTYSMQVPAVSAYEYHPASAYLTLEPSEYAYMSRWNRDNIFRQATSLFLITWYVPDPYQNCPRLCHVPYDWLRRISDANLCSPGSSAS